MGMVREYEDMDKEYKDTGKTGAHAGETDELLEQAQKPPLLSTQINATTDLSVCIRPLCYDVVLGGKHIASFNCPENAITVYHAMRADFKGDVYHV